MSHPGPLRRARGWEPGAAQPPRSIAPSTARDRTRPPARTPRPGQRGPRVPAGTCQGLVHRVAHRSARRSAGRPGLRRAMDSARLPPPRSAPPPPRPARPRRCCCCRRCRLPAAFPARPGPSPPVPAALRPARGSNGAEEPRREGAGGKRGPGSFREDPATAGNYFLPLSLRKEKKDISISPLEKKWRVWRAGGHGWQFQLYPACQQNLLKRYRVHWEPINPNSFAPLCLLPTG